MQITVDHVIRFIERAAALIRDHAAELTELDTVIGDADHGANLNRGFSAVVVKLDTFQESDIGAILDMTGKTLLATVGGASGPLYGTAFRCAGRTCVRTPGLWTPSNCARIVIRLRGRSENRICGIMMATMPF